jgi:two-component system, cell cycle sensor histidine kinase and response regulator CckA
VINSRDVTEQAALEARLLQAQKMEAIGNLAGGVAHDFNNVLTVIRSFSELAVRATPAADARREDLEEIRRAADRGAALVRQLLAFSRRQMLQPQLLGLGQVVAGVEGMLRSLIGEDVRLVTRLGDAPRLVHADRVQMEQVLLNLAVNARDAMPRGGTLTIETEAAPPDVVLRVRDTGHGMTPEVRARVFEPFFTTKPPGRGTGLGLSTVYGIVEQSGGSIAVDSEPGRGTTFTIHLPAAPGGGGAGDAPATALPAAAGSAHLTPPSVPVFSRDGAAAGAAAAGRGPRPTVMLVEDDAAVRALAHRVLREGGFQVLEAGSGDEALRLCAAHGPSVDLLLTDVVMPGMSGRELAERAAALLPRARVLYMSGYTDDEILRRGLRDDSAELIEKPFTPQGLLGKVREVLNGK